VSLRALFVPRQHLPRPSERARPMLRGVLSKCAVSTRSTPQVSGFVLNQDRLYHNRGSTGSVIGEKFDLDLGDSGEGVAQGDQVR